MDLEEADKIRMEWGKFLEFSNGKLMKLFLAEIPESLLPYPKHKIEQALDICIDYFNSEGNQEAIESFESVKASLMFYVPDRQAIQSAAKRFSNPDFLKSF